MTIWDARNASLKLTSTVLADHARLVEEALAAIEQLLGIIEERAPDPILRMTALLLAKADRLAIGAYSMMLDCVGQEAGALMRPLQEVFEMLEYIKLDPARVDEVIEGKAPKAGAIAKRINGNLQDLRTYFNDHASHLSFSHESLGHLVDLESGEIWKRRSPGEGKTLRTNLITLTACLNLVLNQALEIVANVDQGAVTSLWEEHNRRCNEGRSLAVAAGVIPT